MKTLVRAAAICAAVFASSGAYAQDDHSAVELPAACKGATRPAGMEMDSMQSAMQGMGEHQREFMEGMMQTHDPMMQGMMAEDPDIAFACAMIPHHQGAIAMAEVELKYGDAGPMKEMAQRIIEAQKKEIAELTQWIEQQSP